MLLAMKSMPVLRRAVSGSLFRLSDTLNLDLHVGTWDGSAGNLDGGAASQVVIDVARLEDQLGDLTTSDTPEGVAKSTAATSLPKIVDTAETSVRLRCLLCGQMRCACLHFGDQGQTGESKRRSCEMCKKVHILFVVRVVSPLSQGLYLSRL
jgi:hypothetical protein